MSFEEFYETWWLDHENNILAPTPKEAMRQAWLAGRKAEKAAQHSVRRTVDQPCAKHNMEFCVECYPVVGVDFNRR